MLELLHPRRIDRRLAALVDAFRLSIRDLLQLPLAPQAQRFCARAFILCRDASNQVYDGQGN